MRHFTIKQLDYDLTPVAGLSLVGHHLQRLAPVFKRIDAAVPVRTGVASSDILRSYLGLLVQGKSDFDAIENFRGDKFFKHALGIELLASSATLRQRMDGAAPALTAFGQELIETLLLAARPDFGVLPCGWLPLDVDTFAMDNGGTAKEGVGRTYTGVDGYCPLATYLGTQGFCLEFALRPGTQHSAPGHPGQPAPHRRDGAAPERRGTQGADPGAHGRRLRQLRTDRRAGSVQRGRCAQG
jgi:hypothetical protein